MATDAPPLLAPPPRCLRWIRLIIGFICLGLPALGVARLVTIWIQSIDQLQVVAGGQAEGQGGKPNEPAATAAWQVKAETLNGVLGIAWSRDSWSDPAATPVEIDHIKSKRDQHGFNYGQVPAPRGVELDSFAHPRGREADELPPLLDFFFRRVKVRIEA